MLFPRRLIVHRLPVLLILLISFWLMIGSLPHTSATYDEHEYISRGYTYMRTGRTDLKLRHPILLDVLASQPLRLMEEIVLPVDDPALAANNFHLYANIFMWQLNGERALEMIYLARLPALALSLLLIATVYGWTRARFGVTAGLVAAVLAGFDPNLLAHGRLVTPDVGQTALIVLAAFLFWRDLQRPTWPRLLAAGAVLGVAQTAGYPALTLYPLFGVILALHLHAGGRLWSSLWSAVGRYCLLCLVSGLTIWLVYGLSWGPLPLIGINGPAPYYFEEFFDLLNRLDRQDLAYFNGQVYRGGRPLFFIVALLIKTPLPLLLLSAGGFVVLVRQRRLRLDAALWLIPLFYYAVALTSDLNIGYRHIFPVVPFLWLWGGAAAGRLTATWQKGAVALLLLWLMGGTAVISPYFLTYFNELVGGPDGGRRWLVVSDLDWGQDLPALRQFLAEEGVDQPALSYFGTAPPEAYGIRAWPLPAWPPRGIPGQYPFHPDYPPPGVYALSAANLVGARFEETPDLYRWFQAQEPLSRPGNSIYVYRVPRLLDPAAPTVNWAASGVALQDLPADFIENALQTNDIVPRWFDVSRALILPPGRALIQIDEDRPVDPWLQRHFLDLLGEPQSLTVNPAQPTVFYESDDAPRAAANFLSETAELPLFAGSAIPQGEEGMLPAPLSFDHTVTFLGWRILQEGSSERPVEALSIWRIDHPPAGPLAIFVHGLNGQGEIVVQDDRFDATSAFLRPGDVLIQRHQLTLPADGAVEWVALGVYNRETLDRIPVANGAGDRLFVPLAP